MLPVPIVIGLNGIFASTRPATLQIRFTALRTRVENEKTRTGCAAVPIPSFSPITSHSVSARPGAPLGEKPNRNQTQAWKRWRYKGQAQQQQQKICVNRQRPMTSYAQRSPAVISMHF